jgi:hypothetical protein
MPPGINVNLDQRGGFSGLTVTLSPVTAPGAGDAGAAPGDLRAEFDRRKAEIRGMTDKDDAARAAGKLVAESGEFAAEAGALRTETFEELRAEGLTLQQIADRLGIALPTVQKVLERKKRRERARDKKRAGRQPPDVP